MPEACGDTWGPDTAGENTGGPEGLAAAGDIA